MKAYYKAMRLERWPRSFAIFVGSAAFFFLNKDFLALGHVSHILAQAFFSFLLTWAISTANYIINEIVDVPYDIHHPTKRFRPLVKGEINKYFFLSIGIVLTLSSLSLAFIFFSRAFFFSLLSLLLAGFIYNLRPIRTKDIPFLDSISESANNPIRFFIGWYAFASLSKVPPLSLLLCWWAFGNFLMIAKRLSEFRLLREEAGKYRASLGKYSKNALLIGMIVSALFFFVTYFYFAVTFKLQSLFLLSPFILFFLLLIFRKTLQEKEVMEEPERLIKHPKFFIYTIFLFLCFLISFFIDKPGQ